MGLKREQVIVFNDNQMDKVYGKINDAIASYRKNPEQVKEYYEKRKEKRKKIVIFVIASIIIVVLLFLFILEPYSHIESKYIFKTSWGIINESNIEFISPSGVSCRQ